MKNLLIWGAGGHGKVVLDVARSMGTFDRIAFFDDSSEMLRTVADTTVLSGTIAEARNSGFNLFIVAIGPNTTRAHRFREAMAAGLTPASCIHPTAWISPAAVVGKGTVVMPGVVVQVDALVGENCILNTGAIVEHDCIVADHVHLSPAVTLCGKVTVGSFTHLGAGVTVIPGTSIGARAVVGAGAVVLQEIPSDSTAVGVPARVIKLRESTGKAEL